MGWGGGDSFCAFGCINAESWCLCKMGNGVDGKWIYGRNMCFFGRIMGFLRDLVMQVPFL